MAYQSFEKLEVWKKSCRLGSDLFKAMNGSHQYSLKDQILRSVISIASNIAEGAERGNKREFCQFIRYAKGSSAELRTQLYLAKEFGVINPVHMKAFVQETIEISSMLQKLSVSLKTTK